MTSGAGPRHARRRPRWLGRRMGGAALLAAAVAPEVVGAGAPSAQAAERSLVLIDNSHADSWLEVDRAGNLQTGSGIAGSDLDGAVTRLTGAPAHRPARDR
ncbi:hypothetical protein [Streptomyces sp. NPDC048650]|uniref:hypothetical protein n=1 Tax=unclassified Streptomyces TaxID=2593676 RepID=UPI0037146AEF